MVPYKPKRKSYKTYAKKSISKAAVKTMITKATDWSYYVRNENTTLTPGYYVTSLTDQTWNETGKTILKQLKFNFVSHSDGLVRVIIFQSDDKLNDSSGGTAPQAVIDLLTASTSIDMSLLSLPYPLQKKYKILMDKIYLQDADGNGSPIPIQRTFNKMSPLTLSSSVPTAPEGHVYLLAINTAKVTFSSVLKYSS